MRIEYNSPVILNLTFASTLVLLLDQVLIPGLIENFFIARGNPVWSSPMDWLRFFTSIMGHSGWPHLVGNFSLILLVGPMLEERYGSRDLALMIALNALATGIFNAILFQSGLYGASGVVFMLILLASFSNARSGTVPLTFLILGTMYIGEEILESFKADQISQFAHIFGGIVGSFFGFIMAGKQRSSPGGMQQHQD